VLLLDGRDLTESVVLRAEVAELFEPSIEAAFTSIKQQIETTGGFVKVTSF
jgi:hypothetical protein